MSILQTRCLAVFVPALSTIITPALSRPSNSSTSNAEFAKVEATARKNPAVLAADFFL
jgi:hypothetical protein